MTAAAMDVIARTAAWSVEQGDCLDWLSALPDGCCSLAVTSPPYEAARTYGVGFKLCGQAWVDWMIPRVVEASRVVQGLVCINMAGLVRRGRYSPVVEWLVADLTREHGLVCGPAPYVYFRFGIPGSGGPHYHRRDWEPVYCFARPECLPLAWSDNTACGHPPKYAPGGEMSHRLSDGARVNQWGRTGGSESGGTRGKDGKRQRKSRPSHKPSTRRRQGTDEREDMTYDPPAIANPGNVIRERYDAEQVRQLFEDCATRKLDPGDVIRCLVGGNHMGSILAHKNEAPFPERLAEFFVRSYAPPNSIVLDPFTGSGTVAAVSVRLGRRFVGCDLRSNQVEVARRRIEAEPPTLFGA